MKYWIGTSGFQYSEWKGTFYPADLHASRMLPYYAEQFATTEINYTFHRIPAPTTIENWCKLTPANFRFALKAPQKVTHFAKLRRCDDTIDYFYDVICGLGERLGPILFQLPPSLKKDTALLGAFVECLPASMRAAFEFRHASWLDDEVFAVLRRANACLCIADSEKLSTPALQTSNWGYLRLRREDYQDADVLRWCDLLNELSASWSEAFIYFKHEESGRGPKLATQMITALQPAAQHFSSTDGVNKVPE
ncbi:MAG: DUF72 domain-containing protein [Verrucomicrobia bacterium]|nr:DUF72 domain-containing protein [Verrucomicrobiota bacterium]